MIDLQKLLIGMASQALGGGLRSATRPSRGRSQGTFGWGNSRRSRSGLSEGKLLVGLLGVAVAAYEHYSKSSASKTGTTGDGAPPRLPGSAPGIGTSSRPSMPPPPPPAQGLASGKHPPALDPHALLLLRAMIASAYADGTLDEDERRAIVDQLNGQTLSEEEKKFLETELSSARSIQDLVSSAKSFEEKKQVYAAAVLAVSIDSPQELEFLDQLSRALGIDDNARREIDEQLGVSAEARK
jgi:uncharacterized membrane protein YebE (DUF533 family)